MNLKKLTEKEQRFVEEYCKCSNKSQAYQIAFLKDEKSKAGYHRQANKLLARNEIKQAIFMQLISIEKNSKDFSDNLESLKLIRAVCADEILKGAVKKTTIEGLIMSVQEINKMLGLDITTQMNVYTKLADLELRHETLEFNKSKIVKDNEELEKKNISLLDQLANSIKQRREDREKEQEISSNVT